MNGADHYREAERLLQHASRELGAATSNTYEEVLTGVTIGYAAALVHATLAHVAATADPLGLDAAEWNAVIR